MSNQHNVQVEDVSWEPITGRINGKRLVTQPFPPPIKNRLDKELNVIAAKWQVKGGEKERTLYISIQALFDFRLFGDEAVPGQLQ